MHQIEDFAETLIWDEFVITDCLYNLRTGQSEEVV